MRRKSILVVALTATLAIPVVFGKSADPPDRYASGYYATGVNESAVIVPGSPEVRPFDITAAPTIVVSGSVAPDVIGSIDLPSPAIHDVDNATPADGIDLSEEDGDVTINGHIFSRDRHMQGESREVPRSERIRWDVTTAIDGLKHGTGSFGIDSS